MPGSQPPTQQTPIIVPDSPLQQQGSTFLRDFAILLGALPALLAVLGRSDMMWLVDFLSRQDVLSAIGVVVSAVVLVWRQINARATVRKLQLMEPYVPSDIAVKKAAAKADGQL